MTPVVSMTLQRRKGGRWDGTAPRRCWTDRPSGWIRRTETLSPSVVGPTELEADTNVVALEKLVRRGKDEALSLSVTDLERTDLRLTDRHGQGAQNLLHW